MGLWDDSKEGEERRMQEARALGQLTWFKTISTPLSPSAAKLKVAGKLTLGRRYMYSDTFCACRILTRCSYG